MEFLIIFLAVAAFGMRHRWETRGTERAARIEHRTAQARKAHPELDPVQHERTATRAMRADAAYQLLHGFPRMRGDFGAGWQSAKKAHHDWVEATGKKPGLRNAVRAARDAHQRRVRDGQPCTGCGTSRRVAFREDVTKPGWLCRDCWKSAPKKTQQDQADPNTEPQGEPTQEEPAGPTGTEQHDHGQQDRADEADEAEEPVNGRAWRRTRPAAEPGPFRMTVTVGTPVADPATDSTYPPDTGGAEPARSRSIDRGQPVLARPTAQPSARPTGQPTRQAGPNEGNTPVTELTPTSGGALAPSGEFVGIDGARQQLRLFSAQAAAFVEFGERVQAAVAKAKTESQRLATAADMLSANMEHLEVDPVTLAEVSEIFEHLAEVNTALAGLDTNATKLHEAGTGVVDAAGKALTGMNSRHAGVEEAIKGAPVPRTAKRDFYEH